MHRATKALSTSLPVIFSPHETDLDHLRVRKPIIAAVVGLMPLAAVCELADDVCDFIICLGKRNCSAQARESIWRCRRHWWPPSVFDPGDRQIQSNGILQPTGPLYG